MLEIQEDTALLKKRAEKVKALVIFQMGEEPVQAQILPAVLPVTDVRYVEGRI